MITCRKCDVPHPNQAATYPISGFAGRGSHDDAGQWISDDNMLWNWICDKCMHALARALLHPGSNDYESKARKLIDGFQSDGEVTREAVAALTHGNELWLAFYLGRESLQEGKKLSA